MQQDSSSVLSSEWEQRTCRAEKMDEQCFGIFRAGKRQRRENTEAITSASSTTESLLVQDLNRLSVKERDYVFEEIHGVAEVPNETPEFVQEKIQELNKQISELPRNKRQAVDRAFFLRPSYKTNVKFQLMFLRADRFEPLYAARRMALYFESKLELWGEENLVRPISNEMLEKAIEKVREEIEPSGNPEAIPGSFESFSKGSSDSVTNESWHVLPERDQAGRVVIVFATDGHLLDHPRINVLRSWYRFMQLIETNEAAQIHGLLDVTCWTGEQNFSNLFEAIKLGVPKLLYSLPFRFCALHICCYQGPSLNFNKDNIYSASKSIDADSNTSALNPQQQRLWQRITEFIVKQVGRQDRVRFRTHIGSYLEIQYALMSFGIPISFFPSSSAPLIATMNNGYSKGNTGSVQKKTQQAEIDPDWFRRIGKADLKKERKERPSGFSGIEIEYRYPSKGDAPYPSTGGALEQSTLVTAPGSYVEYPQKTDILLGRGRPYQQCPGNIMLGKIVDSYRTQYDATTERLGKVCIVMEVLKTMQEKYGSRLLQHKSDRWEIAEDGVGRVKISAIFRQKRAFEKSGR